MRTGALGVAIVAGLLGLLAADGWSAVQVYRLSQARADIKRQYADVNGIDQGLLSVDAWMLHLRRMIPHQIDHFALSEKQRRAVRDELVRGIDTLLDRVEQLHPDTLKGKLGKAAVGVLVPRTSVPALADALLARAGEPDSRRALKELALEKLDEYAAQTRNGVDDHQELRAYYAQYRVDNRRDFNRVATARAEGLRRRVRAYCSVLVCSLGLSLLAWGLVHLRRDLARLQKPVFVLSVVLALITLLASLGSPMIEVDARIQRVDFLLLGEHLRFDNQVLFYRSKSILQVVWTLLATHQADSMLVGALILLFSIVLPTAKLVSTELVLLGGARLRRSRWLQVLAFKTGKWSMADVLVVAIFMAYVGFKSLLDSQLEDLNIHTQSLSSITTNQTSLQPAFMLFTTFVLFGLLLAELIKRFAAAQSRA